MPVGFRIASAWVDIRAEDKGLKQQIRTAVEKAVRGQEAKIPANFDTKGLRRELDRALKSATRGQKSTIPVKIDSKGLRAELNRAIKAASRGQKTNIPVNIDSKGLRKSIKTAWTAAIAGQTFKLPLTVDSKGLRREINRALREATSGQKPTIKLGINSSGLRAEVNRALRAAMAGQRATVPLHLNTGNFSSTAGKMSRLTKLVVAGVLLIPPALAVVDHAFRALGPSVAVLIPMFTALATMGATIMVGMNGVGEAVEQSGLSAKKYAEALERLTPAARAFVEAIVEQKGAFRDLQRQVQETLFHNMAKDLREMANVIIPDLTIGLGGMAMTLRGMAKGIMNTATALSKTGELKAMFGGLQLAMKPLIPIPGQILNGLVKLSIAAMPLFIRMNEAMGNWFDNMTRKLNEGFANGRLQAAISQSGQDIVNFFRNIANNPEWEQFVSHMKATGPQMAEALRNISEALLKLINNLSPLAGAVIILANAFAKMVISLPDEFVKIVMSLVGALALYRMVAGGILATTAAIVALKGALMALGGEAAMIAAIGPAMGRVGASAGAIRGTALAVGMLARAGLALGAIWLIFKGIDTVMGKLFGDRPPQVDKLTESLIKFNKTGELSGEAARVFEASWSQSVDGADKKFGGLHESIKGIAHAGTWDKIFNGFQKATNWIDPGKTKLEEYKEKVGAVDSALAKMVKGGHVSEAQKSFALLSKEAAKAGTSSEKFKSLLPKYTEELKKAKDAQKQAAETMGVFGESAINVSGRLKQLKADTEGLTKSIFEMNNVNRNSIDTAREWEKSADDLAAASKKKGINLSYENGVLSQNNDLQRESAQALQTHAANTEKNAMATYQATGSWESASKILNDGKAALIASAKQMGMNETQAREYAAAVLNIPTQKQINIQVAGQAESQLQAVAAAYRATPNAKTVNVGVLSATAVKVLTDLGYKIEELPDGTFTVTAKKKQAEADLEYLENYKISPKTVEVLAKITSLTVDIDKAQNKVDSLKQKRDVAVGAQKKKLDKEVAAAQKKLDGLKQKRAAEIKALDKTGPGVKAAQDRLDGVKDKKVTITVATILQQSTQTTADAIRKQAEAQSRAAKGKRWGGAIRRASGGSVGGGFVSGPGGPTSDKIKALLSNGEYVIRASSVSKYGSAMMGDINNGRFPKYAAGGAVSGGSAGSAVSATPTSGTFTVTDATGKPVASALNNFKALQDGAKKTYAAISTETAGFGKNLTSGVQQSGSQSVAAWNAWATGMKSKTDSGYKGVRTLTDAFSRNQVAKTTATKSGTHSVWGSWGTGMQSRTKSTYANINAATSTFAKQSTSKIGNARDGMGSAWGGLSPKFKPPVSYLVHTVINKGVVGSMNAIMQKLGGGKNVSGISVPGFATGGAINGPGSKTSDSIMARLSNGEFVMQAKAVDKFGVGFMSQVNQGKLPHDGAGFTGFSKGGGVNISMPAFAGGGAVGVPSADALNKIMGDGDSVGVKRMTDYIMNNYVLPLIDSGSGGSAMKDVQRAGVAHIRGNVEKFVKENFGGAGSAAAGLRWAKTQDGKPYQWGGNGNPSWDCSGFMSAIESVIRGEKPHRRWSTHAFNGGTPPGWKAGAKAPFTVGITHAGVGHTAGSIGKTNVESSGSGVQVGGGARGTANGMFTSRYGYVGPNATKKARGGYISGPGGPTSDQVPAWLSNGEYVIRSAAVKRFGTSALNAINSGKMPGFASGGSVSDTTYKIKYGDTLSGIAVKFKTTVKALMALNKTITNANKIYAGKTIVISKGSGSGGGGTTPTTPPGFSLPSMSKVGKSGIQSTDGTNDLKGFVTLSQASIEANKAGANIKNEIHHALASAENFGALKQNFYDLQAKIKAAFKGSAETAMLSRFNTVVKALTPLQQSLDGVNGKLETASKELEDVKGKFDGLKDSVSSAIMDFGNITKIGKWGTNPQTLLNQLQTDVTKANAFGTQLEQLKAKGINSDLIGKIAEAGITGGGAATAASLLNMTPAQVAQLNALQAQLTTAADKTGTAAANGMYGAGVNAAQGIVDGLKSQQKAIEAQMVVIALAMEKAIKQALGIKSPSTLMAKVGNFTVDGLLGPVFARKAEANEAIRGLVPSDKLVGATPYSASRGMGAGTISSGAGVTNIGTINVNVSGTFDLTKTADRRAIAQALVVEIKEEIRRDDKKRR